VDLSVDVARAVAAGVLGLYIAWRAASVLMGREHIGAAGGEVVKEFLAWAVVFAVVTQYAVVDQAVLKGAVENLKGVVDEAYIRVVKYEQCVANIRLSGPFAAYAGYAEAKFAVYRVMYETAIGLYSQLAGAARLAVEIGPLLLAVGWLLYAAWLRPLGGVLLGLTLGVLVGVAVVGPWAYGQISHIADSLKAMDFHPFVNLGCDDDLVGKYKADVDKWRLVNYGGVFALMAITALGAAAGAVLSRH